MLPQYRLSISGALQLSSTPQELRGFCRQWPALYSIAQLLQASLQVFYSVRSFCTIAGLCEAILAITHALKRL